MLPIEKLDSSIQLKPTTTRLVSFSGNLVETEGTVVLPVSYRGKQYSLQFYFVNKPVQAILGLKACEQLNVIQRVEEMSKTLKSAERDIFVAYKDVFSTNSIGCLLTTYYIEIDKNVRPVIHAPIYDELIFKRNKVIIPAVSRKEMLKIVHQPHLSVEESKPRAREALFWPEWIKRTNS